MGACAATTAARGLGLRGATSLALLGRVGWENWEGDALLGLLILGVFGGCSHNCCQGGIGGSSMC